MAQTFNYPLNIVSSTATTISNIFIPSNATIGNVFYTTLTTGNLVVNNVNLGIASLFSGSFIAANNTITPTAITGLSFSSANIRYFEAIVTVNINTTVATSFDSVFTIRGNYNDSGWAIISSYIGDNSGVVFSINTSGQILYTSTNIANFSNSTFRYKVEQFTINGTYTSILGNTQGSYLLNSVQINSTTDSIPGTSNGGLYVLGGSTITKQVNILNTANSIGLGTGGSLTVLGGASISQTMIIGSGLNSSFNSNTLGNLYTTGGNIGINTITPAFSLDVIGTGRFTNLISTTNTLTNLFSTNNTSTNLIYTNATGTSLNLTGLSATNAIFTGITTTNLIYTNATGTSLNLTGLSATNAIFTGITTTNVLITNSITVNSLLATTSLSTANVYSTNITSTNIVALTGLTSGTNNITGLSFMRFTTNAIGTYIQTGVNGSIGSSQNLYFTNINASNYWMTLTSIGNLGIGTTTPAFTLDVNGSLRLSGSGQQTVTFKNNPTGTTLDISPGYRGGTLTGGWTTLDPNNGTSGSYGIYIFDGLELAGGSATTLANVLITSTLNATFNSNTLGSLFTTNGNVGIGTVTPIYPLHVTGNIYAGPTTFTGATGATGTINTIGLYTKGVFNSNVNGFPATTGTVGNAIGLRVRGGDDAVMDFGVNTLSGSWIQTTNFTGYNQNYPLLLNPNGGNIGIGTNTPTTTLDVNGNIRMNTSSSTTSNRITTSPTDNFFYSSNTVGHYSLMWAIDQATAAGPMSYLSGYGGQRFFTTGQPRMVIDVNGSVGINTTSPAFTLDVAGSGRFTGNINLSGGSLIPINNSTPIITYNGNVVNLFQNTAAAGSNVELQFGQSQSTNNNAILDFNYTASGSTTNSFGLGFYGANSKLVVQAGGNVGIGTTNPSYALDVNGSGRFSGDIFLRNNRTSLSTNGYTMLPGGILMNWGQVSLTQTSTQVNGTVTFSSPFSATVYSVTATIADSNSGFSNFAIAGGNSSAVMVYSFTSTTFTWSVKSQSASNTANSFSWISIGAA